MEASLVRGKLNIFLLFRLLKSSLQKSSEISLFVKNNFALIKSIYSEMMAENIMALNVESEFFSKVAKSIDDLLEVVRITQNPFFLGIMSTLFGIENGKIDACFEEKLNSQEFVLTNSKLAKSFIEELINKNTAISQQTLTQLLTEDKSMNKLMFPFLEKLSGEFWNEILESQLENWIAFLGDENNSENQNEYQIYQTILVKKSIINILKIGFSKTTRVEILEKLLPNVLQKSPVFKNSCDVIEKLIIVCKKWMKAVENVATNTDVEIKVEKGVVQDKEQLGKMNILRFSMQQSFNLVALIAMLTQTDIQKLVKTTFLNKSKEIDLPFRSAFIFSTEHNFQVLTNFKEIEICLIDYDFPEQKGEESNLKHSMSLGFNFESTKKHQKTIITFDQNELTMKQAKNLNLISDSKISKMETPYENLTDTKFSKMQNQQTNLDYYQMNENNYSRLFSECQNQVGFQNVPGNLTTLNSAMLKTFTIPNDQQKAKHY